MPETGHDHIGHAAKVTVTQGSERLNTLENIFFSGRVPNDQRFFWKAIKNRELQQTQVFHL
jgi:hypothetical protein